MKYKFNVRPSDCKFIVNKEKGIVTCIYDNSAEVFLRFIEENFKLKVFETWWLSKDLENFEAKMYMPNRFVGIATCSKDDEWNEATGRAIAFSRMKDKLNRSFFKRAKTFFRTVDTWLDESVDLINEIGMKLENNQEKRHKYIESLMKE